MRKIATVFAFAFVMAIAPLALAEPPSNDGVSQAEEMTLPFADVSDTSEATTELGEPTTNCDILPTQRTIWYSLTPQESGPLFFDTLGSDFDTITAIYIKNYVPDLFDVTGFEGLSLVDCQDQRVQEEFSLWLDEGFTYLFQVGGHLSDPGGVVHFNAYEGASVSGRVTDESGAPLSRVCVTVGTEPYWYEIPEYYYWYGWFRSDLTDEDGNYTVEDIPPGEYVVSFRDCDNDLRDFLPEYYNDKTDPSEADVITLEGSQVVTGIDAALKSFVRPTPPPPVYTDLTVSDLEVTKAPIETDYGHVGYSGYVRDITAEVGNDSTQTAWASLRISACTDDGCRTIRSSSLQLEAGTSRTEKFRWDATGYLGDVTIVAKVSPAECNMFDSDTSNDTQRLDHYVIVGGTGVSATTPLAPDPYYEDYPYYYDDYYGGCRISVVRTGDSPPA